MNLDKAIELNDQSEDSLRSHKFIDHADAVKLANQALIRMQQGREKGYDFFGHLLPGETDS